MKIFLEHAGTPLYELHTNEYNREIVIGRSSECTWTLDEIDNSTSSKHAMISKRKNNFYITDLGSRNGIFFQNKRIKEKKLVLGDRISLGECTVAVEADVKKDKRAARFHRLEYTNEKGRKTLIDITKSRTVIGSSRECDIIFPDQLISSQHAELLLRSDGSCWIKDLNSRNGTSINGTGLIADGERMLQDNDVITIAYLDIRFFDADTEHHNSRVWTTVITLAVTVLVIMGGYIGYLKLTPDSNELLRMAGQEMKAGRYESAKRLINEAGYAENSDNTRYEREQLARRILQWESIIQMWDSVQKDLLMRYYNRATQKLSSVNHDDFNSWSWYGGVSEKNKALSVKKLLDACSASRAVLRNEVATMDDVEKSRRELTVAMTEASRFEDAYFIQTMKDARPLLQQIENTLNEDKELQATLALLDVARPDYLAVLRRLEKVSRESAGPVKSRADRVLPAIQTLNRETLRVQAMVDKVCEMDFETVEGFRLDLPDAIDYSSEKNIGSLRKQLINTVSHFQDTATQLSLIHKTLISRGVAVGKSLPEMDAFLNQDNLKSLYGFDCLDMPLPNSSRKTPCGKYDELLGIEFFYDYISNIHAHTLTVNVEELPFKPSLFRLREVVGEIEKFIRFADKDENQWFNREAFAEYLIHCRGLLKMRDQIVANQLKLQHAPGTRLFLVSRGVAAYLSSDHTAVMESVGKAFGIFKRDILKLNREYNTAMPEDALAIRRKIIDMGLPGDPILKKMWQQRPISGWGSK